MNKFEKAKNDYINIQAPESLHESVKNTIKTSKPKHVFYAGFATAAACLLLTFILSLNIFPSLAYAISDLPYLDDIVRIVTFGRYEYKDNGYEAKIVTPKIEGLLDKELENKLNNEFKENAAFVIAAYEKDVKALKKEFGDETVHMAIESDYIVKTDTPDILAIDIYIFSASGSSSTKHTFYTINKKTGELLTLSGLFKEGSDYISVLSRYIKGEMQRRNDEENGMFWLDSDGTFEGFENISATQNFYINSENDLVICFDKYEVAAGAQGSPEFIIPQDIIKDILK